jgi:hypothetical protein
MDFQNAQLPSLIPLAGSFVENDVESDLRRMALDLFAAISSRAFDANALGVSHLGSMDLVRRAMALDGLESAKSEGEEPAIRYLLRAWKAGNSQGRGLHFLRTYLQMLFPNGWGVYQLWQKKTGIYPTELYRKTGEDDFYSQIFTSMPTGLSDYYLTNRLKIAIVQQDTSKEEMDAIKSSIASVLPARMVPSYTQMQNGQLALKMLSSFTGAVSFSTYGAPIMLNLTSESPVLRSAASFSYIQFMQTHGDLQP